MQFTSETEATAQVTKHNMDKYRKYKTQTAVINKWDHFDILAKGKTDYHCKIKETLFIQEHEPAFNVNVGREKLMLYYSTLVFIVYCYVFA